MADADEVPSSNYPRSQACGLPRPALGQRFHLRRLYRIEDHVLIDHLVYAVPGLPAAVALVARLTDLPS